ncbi:MAG: hypothetical protein AB7P20_08575 [Rhizobiaceae bacterium]
MGYGFRFSTARDLFDAFPTAGEDMRAAPTDQPSLTFCRSLVASRIPEEAITFCAYLLPGRVAVWWGHECLVQLSSALNEQDFRMLALVHGWVSDPSEYRRFVVLDEALAAEERTPAVWIALAAGWSEAPGASNGQAQMHSRTARALNTGILAGLARVALADRAPALTDFVAMGMQLAEFEASRLS